MASGEWTRPGERAGGAKTWATGAGLTLLASVALAGPVPGYDFEWAVIGDVDNRPIFIWHNTWPIVGRGSVGYHYRISKYEVTSAQWLEFVNTFATQSNELANFASPTFWGGTEDPDYDGPGTRYILRNVPDADRMPVFGITWREAAQYCNWLHNNKRSDLDAIADGAYDTSTFQDFEDGSFSDQRTRSPGARFWIPSWDEYLKAAHYNPVTGDWNKWPIAENRPPVPGLPGRGGETSAGVHECGGEYARCPYDIPLGAYEVTSPYGLYDLSGGTTEWTEELINQDQARVLEGLYAGANIPENMLNGDVIFFAAESEAPWSSGRHGLRIAGAVSETETDPQFIWLPWFSLQPVWRKP